MCYMGVFTEGNSPIPTVGDTIVREARSGGFRDYTLLHITPDEVGYTMTLWDNDSGEIISVIGTKFAEIIH